MARDLYYQVIWKPGEIKIHASSAKQAMQKATEYLLVEGAGRIQAKEIITIGGQEEIINEPQV